MYMYEKYGKAVSSLQNAHLLLYEMPYQLFIFIFR